MKKYIYIFIILIFALAMVGCKKDKEENKDPIQEIEDKDKPTPTVAPTVTPIPTEAPIVEENHDGEMRSTLTGLWVPIEIGNRRPYAIQFNNFKTVRNQWGIGEADIVYEALVEGGITRLLAIGENFTSDKIGSVRSSRHYYVSFADEYDAIYIHYGKTKYAVSKLKELAIDNIDGETGIGNTVFYRDKKISAPNNAFTSADRILEGINIKEYRQDHGEDFEPHFSFYEEDTELLYGTSCNKVSIKYPYNKPYLTYNPEDKLYYRYQFGEIHKDSNTGEQLKFKNIIIQFVREWDIDKNDYQTMSLEDAEGTGFYISNGQAIPITWEKNEKQKWMKYFDVSGHELKLNQGKTYIAIYPDNQTKDVVIN
ncbi:MAG: DUF3048 domain-containing protein [Clostridiales bacterium]|nr:DUF3048 domain-containing protein [Clostridiales bacterium]